MRRTLCRPIGAAITLLLTLALPAAADETPKRGGTLV
jgi:hypothetical protein